MADDILAFLSQHIDVSRETYDKLKRYHDLLLKWQIKINLVGPDTIAVAWQRHFLDSLQLIKHIPKQSQTILDLGSGAGFPGMVLAIADVGEVHLIESDAKKITFLREVARMTDAPVYIHHCRIEDRPIEHTDVITSRACSSLDKLLDYSSPYVSHETICLFHKGKNYSTDIEDAKEHWLFEHTITPSITDTQGVILTLSHLKKRGV